MIRIILIILVTFAAVAPAQERWSRRSRESSDSSLPAEYQTVVDNNIFVRQRGRRQHRGPAAAAPGGAQQQPVGCGVDRGHGLLQGWRLHPAAWVKRGGGSRGPAALPGTGGMRVGPLTGLKRRDGRGAGHRPQARARLPRPPQYQRSEAQQGAEGAELVAQQQARAAEVTAAVLGGHSLKVEHRHCLRHLLSDRVEVDPVGVRTGGLSAAPAGRCVRARRNGRSTGVSASAAPSASRTPAVPVDRSQDSR